jgi:DNA-binding HxlR family transcriptional regulator
MKHRPSATDTAPPDETTPDVRRMVEDIVGCKWSLGVLGAVKQGIRRPGAMEHHIEGLSKKVLSERLAKLVRYGILERRAFAEVPPRVEYSFTPFGQRLCEVLDRIDELQREWPSVGAAADTTGTDPGGPR